MDISKAYVYFGMIGNDLLEWEVIFMHDLVSQVNI